VVRVVRVGLVFRVLRVGFVGFVLSGGAGGVVVLCAHSRRPRPAQPLMRSLALARPTRPVEQVFERGWLFEQVFG